MGSFVLSRAALADIKEISRYTYRKWGREQRDKYVRALYRSFEQAAADELVSTDCSYISAGYRRYYVGRHCIFFKKSEAGDIEVIRVLHQSMDVNLQLH